MKRQPAERSAAFPWLVFRHGVAAAPRRLDDRGRQEVAGARAAIERCGATLFWLPPRSLLRISGCCEGLRTPESGTLIVQNHVQQ